MKNIKTDYLIIGAGTAGLGAYSVISRQTDNVLMVQYGPYGTTCARVGCMPSKMLITASDYAHHIKEGAFFGVKGQNFIDGVRVFERLRHERDHRFVARNLEYVNKIPNHHKLEGRARFIGPNKVQVDENTQINAEKIIIACGSRPNIPDVFKPVEAKIQTSDTIFEMKDLPKSIGVVGLGVIALELGQALHRLGVETTLFGRSGHIGGLTNPDLKAQTLDIFKEELTIHEKGQIQNTWLDNDLAYIAFRQADGTIITKGFEQILVAGGRISNVDGLNLEKTGLVADEKGLFPFDKDRLNYNGKAIFIAGDAGDMLPLWHTAFDEGRIAANNALSYPKLDRPKRKTNLAIYFTDPQMAIIGNSFQALQGTDFITASLPFSASPRHIVWNKVKGTLQIYADAKTGEILGAEILGERAEHFAHLLALAITHEMTASQILQMPIYHPTAEELIRDALMDIVRQVNKA